MGRAGGPGEIRLPRPQDADRAADRGRAGGAARHRHRSRRASRSTTRRPTSAGARGSGRRVPAGKRRACAARCSTCGPTVSRTSSRWSRSIGPGPMANIPTYCARKHGMEEPDYIHPKLEPILTRDLRRHRLPGAGDAGRADPRRLLARRGRSAAPRHGQENPQGDAGAAQPLRRGRDRARHRALRRPTRSSICSSASPNTASTRATPPPMRWSPTRPPI